MEINQYPLESLTFQDNDYYDIDFWTGSGYQTKKILGSVIKAGILAAVENIYNADGTLLTNRNVNLGNNTLEFIGIGNDQLRINIDNGINSSTFQHTITQIFLSVYNIFQSSGSTASLLDNSLTFELEENGSVFTTFQLTFTEAYLQYTDGIVTHKLAATENGIEINSEYILPNTDGSAGQVMTTDGAGVVSWQDPTAPTIVDSAKREVVEFINKTGAPILEGTIVYLKTTSSSGTHPEVELADASTEATSSKTIGAIYETTANDAIGLIVTSGEVDNLDTSMYSIGDRLWLSTTAGQVTTTEPLSPNQSVFIGFVTRAQNGNGRILYNIQNGLKLIELHDVSVPSPNNGDVLTFNSVSGLWEAEAVVESNIYNTDGTLTGNRVVDLDGNTIIFNDGKVGVNVTPNFTLQVRGTAVPSAGETIARFDVSDSSAYLSVGNGTSTNGTFAPMIQGRQIGTITQPALITESIIDVADDTGTTPITVFKTRLTGLLQVVNRPVFRFSNWTLDIMTMLANGNVGIGTTTPTEKLEVNGKTKTSDFQMTNTPTEGYVLTSDGSGNGTWKPVGGVLGAENYITASTQWSKTLPAPQTLNNGEIANGFTFFDNFLDKVANGTTPYYEFNIDFGITITLSGTSGTANINVNGVNYLATFNTSLYQTAVDWVSLNQATLNALGIVVFALGSGADGRIRFGSSNEALLNAISITNVTTDLSGVLANEFTNLPTAAGDHIRVQYNGEPIDGQRLLHTIRANFNITVGSVQYAELRVYRYQNDSVIGSGVSIQRNPDESGQQVVIETYTGSSSDAFVTGGFYIAVANNSGTSLEFTGPSGILISSIFQKPTLF